MSAGSFPTTVGVCNREVCHAVAAIKLDVGHVKSPESDDEVHAGRPAPIAAAN